jgi:hypothetical protein
MEYNKLWGPRRKITVTSSLNEISTDQWENRLVVRGEALLCPPHPFLNIFLFTMNLYMK